MTSAEQPRRFLSRKVAAYQALGEQQRRELAEAEARGRGARARARPAWSASAAPAGPGAVEPRWSRRPLPLNSPAPARAGPTWCTSRTSPADAASSRASSPTYRLLTREPRHRLGKSRGSACSRDGATARRRDGDQAQCEVAAHVC